MRMVFTGYTGNTSQLSRADQKCLEKMEDLYIDIPLTKPNKKLLKDIDVTVNLRDLLSSTYPGVQALHEYASESVKATRTLPSVDHRTHYAR